MPFDGTGYEGRIEALEKMDKVIDLLAVGALFLPASTAPADWPRR